MTEAQRYRGQFRPEFSRLHLDRDLRWVVPLTVRYVVAVTGTRFAGKSAALAYLSEKKGFEVYNIASDLREIAVRLGVPLEPRYRLQDLGDELRAATGDAAYLARITLRRIHRDHLNERGGPEPPRRIAVGGFKRPEELRLFEGLGRFEQFDIQTHPAERFARARRSGIMERELAHRDPAPALDFEAFERHIEQRDLYGDDNRWTSGYGQAVAEVVQLRAATPIINNGTLAQLDVILDQEVRALDTRFRAFSA